MDGYFGAAEINEVHRVAEDNGPEQVAADEDADVGDAVAEWLWVGLRGVQELQDPLDHERS